MLTVEWNAEQARAIAHEEGIEVGEAKTKAEITQIIRMFFSKRR